METRYARCSCGSLQAECAGQAVLVSACHCDECQRRTGSVFGAAAFFDRAHVSIRGESTSFTRNSESGHTVRFHFCPMCGSTVYWEPERKPGLLAVALGAFAGGDVPPPTQSVWDAKRRDWIVFPAHIKTRPGA